VAAGYFGYALVRLAVRAGQAAAFGQAAKLWEAERWLHVDIGPPLNHLVAAEPALAEVTGYYYGLLHFIVTPLTLAWLYLRRPAAFPRLRSALVLATAGANLVYWTWPVAPPRFVVHGMTDVLTRYHILGAGDPRGPDSMVNLYAAMPSLHVAWAIWCAVAVVTATRTRWRHLAWLYPVATTFVVLASANHFVLDAVGGAAIIVLGLLAARGTTARARGPAPPIRHPGLPAGLEPNPGPSGTVLANALAGQPAPGTHRAVAAWTQGGNPRPQPRSRSPCPDESAHTGKSPAAGPVRGADRRPRTAPLRLGPALPRIDADDANGTDAARGIQVPRRPGHTPMIIWPRADGLGVEPDRASAVVNIADRSDAADHRDAVSTSRSLPVKSLRPILPEAGE
jgi:PAP2 superfamily